MNGFCRLRRRPPIWRTMTNREGKWVTNRKALKIFMFHYVTRSRSTFWFCLGGYWARPEKLSSAVVFGTFPHLAHDPSSDPPTSTRSVFLVKLYRWKPLQQILCPGIKHKPIPLPLVEIRSSVGTSLSFLEFDRANRRSRGLLPLANSKHHQHL